MKKINANNQSTKPAPAPGCTLEPELPAPLGQASLKANPDYINWIDPKALKPHPDNPRKHNRKQRRKLKKSLKRYGCLRPVVIARGNIIICGHGIVEAAIELGMDTLPTIDVSHLNEADLNAYMIADNRLAQDSTWDYEILTSLFIELCDPDLDFDIELSGFEVAEIDFLIQEQSQMGSAVEEEVMLPDPKVPVISRLGDTWQIGRHRLRCGDARIRDDYLALMDDELAAMAFTDVPYNLPIHGHVCGLGKIRHDDFVMASGEMSEAQFTAFLSSVMALMVEFSTAGSVHYHFMDWRHLFEMLSAAKQSYSAFLNLCVWAKSNGGMGGLYRSQHELVLVFRNGDRQHINNVELGKYGRNRTNVWQYPGVNLPTKEARDQLALHPTVKPVQLVADAILDVSKRKDIVLDPFCGSGTTILAAEQTGRRALPRD